MCYRLVEVNSAVTRKAFLSLPIGLYRGNPNWIRPLDRDIESVFNPKTNKLFRNGEAVRWLLRDENGKTVGRVAAFIDYSSSHKQAQPIGGMGFFECINSQSAANTLFDSCRSWLSQRGVVGMEGPVNFGERDRWWGLHVEGDSPPNYCMGYHMPYYQSLFESYGFAIYYRQLTFHRHINAENVDPIIWEKAKRIAQIPEYHIENISKKNIGRYAVAFQEIYNKAWKHFPGFKPIAIAHAFALLKRIKPILDEKLILFAFHNDTPVGFLIMLPELNQVVKHLNGKLNLYSKLKMLYLLKVKRVCTKALGIIYGTVPEHQGKGLEGALINGLAGYALKHDFPYKELEMNWIGDFNPGMIRIIEQVGGRVCKVHHTYRYMFERTKGVERHKLVS